MGVESVGGSPAKLLMQQQGVTPTSTANYCTKKIDFNGNGVFECDDWIHAKGTFASGKLARCATLKRVHKMFAISLIKSGVDFDLFKDTFVLAVIVNHALLRPRRHATPFSTVFNTVQLFLIWQFLAAKLR